MFTTQQECQSNCIDAVEKNAVYDSHSVVSPNQIEQPDQWVYLNFPSNTISLHFFNHLFNIFAPVLIFFFLTFF